MYVSFYLSFIYGFQNEYTWIKMYIYDSQYVKTYHRPCWLFVKYSVYYENKWNSVWFRTNRNWYKIMWRIVWKDADILCGHFYKNVNQIMFLVQNFLKCIQTKFLILWIFLWPKSKFHPTNMNNIFKRITIIFFKSTKTLQGTLKASYAHRCAQLLLVSLLLFSSYFNVLNFSASNVIFLLCCFSIVACFACVEILIPI